jgi:hypothetical protein
VLIAGQAAGSRAFEDAMEERLLPALLGPGPRDDILAEARGFAPDLMVVDCMMGAGLEAAHSAGFRRALPAAGQHEVRRPDH